MGGPIFEYDGGHELPTVLNGRDALVQLAAAIAAGT